MSKSSKKKPSEELGAKEILAVLAVLLFWIVLSVAIAIDAITPDPSRGTASQTTNRTTELLQLHLSKEYVESGNIEGRVSGNMLGTVGYVQGSSEGRPVTYIYIRYRAENGDIIDRLIPRDNVRLRDDLAPGAPATVEIEVVKKREASYEDIQKDPTLCHDGKPGHKSKELPAEDCGVHPDDPAPKWKLEREDPIVIHVPKDSIIVTINPNLVPETAQKQ